MMPLFQLSTRTYDKEIEIVKNALLELEKKCSIAGGFELGEPFMKFGWTFFNLQITNEMASVIEKSGLMEGALGYSISEQLKNFLGHFLESKGSKVRITQTDY